MSQPTDCVYVIVVETADGGRALAGWVTTQEDAEKLTHHMNETDDSAVRYWWGPAVQLDVLTMMSTKAWKAQTS